jgi:hypothetical protein
VLAKLKYGGWKKSCTSWQVVYPIIYRVSTIQGGAGFLPSTVLLWIVVTFIIIIIEYQYHWYTNVIIEVLYLLLGTTLRSNLDIQPLCSHSTAQSLASCPT